MDWGYHSQGSREAKSVNEIAKTNPARGVETGPEPKPKPPCARFLRCLPPV
jgi:hypothetical protein